MSEITEDPLALAALSYLGDPEFRAHIERHRHGPPPTALPQTLEEISARGLAQFKHYISERAADLNAE